MSKKRRPHKPGHFHRQPTQAPTAAGASGAAPATETWDADAAMEAARDIADESESMAEVVDVLAASPVAETVEAGEAAALPVAAESPAAFRTPAQGAFSAVPAASEPPALTDIRGVLIQVAGARLLLPNATIAEVLSYADPEPVGGEAPDWLLGRMRWRGWQLPLIAFGRLAGVAEEKAALGSKVVVLKALAGTGRTPYFAMLTQGFPRLVTVSRGGLELEDDNADAMPRGVQARVRLNENEALLPDLEAIEALVGEALEQAA